MLRIFLYVEDDLVYSCIIDFGRKSLVRIDYYYIFQQVLRYPRVYLVYSPVLSK